MKKNKIIILSILLLAATGRYFIQDHTSIRTVDFIQIFTMGLLFGLLSLSLLKKIKNKE
ncbi:hypothetical protein NAT51_05895 [Flavobacterium amniphilum]|uniref:hypothetical protein n=1 Tax=Flavobacterium amniphilum TaxID=1834035 RepID=UPI00202A7F36|nr:hypothetical protein [Flavobacterium amniphilum]MCL9805040.1 hypothetical protein [Flavobacterium amniphilum]